jgi:glycosyltransferase involved in cell wall biosynthesis
MGIAEKNFSFTGHLGYFERPEVLGKATVFVNPSFFENCSLSILEAMSCNAAVVASDVGGNSEIIESGRNGVLTPLCDHKMLAESIISLLMDDRFNKRVGREARKTVEERFSSQKCAEQTYNVYKHILDVSN